MARKSGLSGMSNLRRVLRRLPKEATGDVRIAIEHGANLILRDARGRVAGVSKRVSSNLSVKLSTDKFTARVGLQGKRAKKRAFMGKWIEYGTAPHSLKSGSRLAQEKRRRSAAAGTGRGGWHPGTPARPFMIPAYESNKQKLIAMIRAAVDRSLRRGAGKA